MVRRGHTEDAVFDPALVRTVSRTTLQIDILETGKIEPREKVELKSKVAGQVARVLVEEGAHVKRGDLLLALDPTDYQREVERAAAEIAVIDSGISLATATLARNKAGVEAGFIAAQEAERSGFDVRGRGAQRRLAQVALRSAEDRLRYTQLLSPMDGVVIQRHIEPGEVVTPGVQSTFDGRPLLTVADLSRLVVRVELNQIDVAKVALGQTATLTLDALPGESYAARVTKIAPASVRQAGKDLETFPVELLLDAEAPRIKPGMSADVRVHTAAKEGVLAVPIEAVKKDQGKAFLTRIVEGPEGKTRTEPAEVTLGAKNDREVEIVSGVDEGAKILVDPASAAENEAKL